MPINRNLWLKPFNDNNLPNWTCPTCGVGILRLAEGGFKSAEDGYTIRTMNTVDYDYEETNYRHIIMLTCNNEFCKENVACIGQGIVDNVEGYDDKGQPESFFTESYFPEYFVPSLLIFPFSKKCPNNVVDEIMRSFRLFFADPPASANYVRKAIEAILTNKGIRRFLYLRGRRMRINLHNRIVEFEKTKPEIAKKLFAIKWLGNEGSHTDTITKNDVLDAYEILESILDDLYIGYRKLVEIKVTKINKSKKPLHPST